MKVKSTASAITLAMSLHGCVSITPEMWRPYMSPQQAANASKGTSVGERFPDLVFRDWEGKERNLSDFKGKVVFLNFWASWCPPCVREWPGLERLYQNMKSQPDLVFLVLNMKEAYEVGQEWASRKKYTVPLSDSMLLSRSKMATSDGGVYSVSTVPDTFILDRNGIVLAAYLESQQAPDFDKLAEAIMDVINETKLSDFSTTFYDNDGVIIEVRAKREVDGKRDVTLSFSPKPNYKLVGKVGISVRPVTDKGVSWPLEMPITIKSNAEYFDNNPTVALSYIRTSSNPVLIDIDYGYCKDISACYLNSVRLDIAPH